MPESAELDPLRQSVSEALTLAKSAYETATKALEVSRSTADQVLDLRHSQQRTEASLNTHRTKSEERHAEVMSAIEGAMKNDKSLAEKQTALESKLSTGDIGKIAGGVTALLVAVAGAITLAATQLAPVLPSVVQARYATPPVIVTVSAPPPSAAPAGSR